MAAPSVTARIKPSGFKLEDGHPTTIAFALNPAVQLWERTVKPPGIDGGDPIPQTTMHNSVWRTMAPKRLKTLTEVSGKAGYDPNVYPGLVAMINLPTSITIHFPDNAQISFYGFLQKAEPEEVEEGKMPELTYTIGITNWDYVNFVEAGPLYTPAAGTA